jgi:hypothetical protein
MHVVGDSEYAHLRVETETLVQINAVTKTLFNLGGAASCLKVVLSVALTEDKDASALGV